MTKKNKKTKKMNKNTIILIVAACVIIVAVIGCFFLFKKAPKSPNISNDSNQQFNIKDENKLKIVDLNSKSRNRAVMINNIKTVWGYQSGIQDAYIVYEIIAEGGITRLMAIYKDANPERIGTIRSTRAYYLDYALENDAILLHIGGSPEALSDIRTLGINDLDGDGTFRDKSLGLATEHTAFSSMARMNEKIVARKFRDTANKDLLLNYSVDEIDLSTKEGAIPANNVAISFSTSKDTSFVYDAEAKNYKRFQSNKAHTDYVKKKQYTVKNIITYQVSNSTYDYKGRQTLNNIGTGSGYFISNGYAVPITWEKKTRNDQTVYKYLNGEEIVVNDGNTHIEIQPKNRSININ